MDKPSAGNRQQPVRRPNVFMAEDGASSWEEARVAVLPVPYDYTSSYVSGSRNGPAAILAASKELEPYDMELGRVPADAGIFTLDSLEAVAGDPAGMIASIESSVGGILDAGKFPVLLGGEHTITLGAIRALRSRKELPAVLVCDAHADLRESFQGSPLSHACVCRRILDLGVSIYQFGIRSATEEEMSLARNDQRVFSIPAHEMDRPEAIDALNEALPSTIYVSVDLDVLDPSEMPATGTPEPGGVGWRRLWTLLEKLIAPRAVLGLDMVELRPIPGFCAPDFAAAKLLYRLIDASVSRRSGKG